MAGKVTWEAVGEEEALLYTVTLPEGITPRRIRYRILVANDYRIGVSQTHMFANKERTTPVFILRRARGGICFLTVRRDGHPSNLPWWSITLPRLERGLIPLCTDSYRVKLCGSCG